VFDRPAELQADTLYVVGGLYGNPFALDAIEALFVAEPRNASKRMVFNGDFHWFDTDPKLFGDLDARVHRYLALRGNVETEIASDELDAGCGCAYPENVADETVARSNQIIDLLRRASHCHPTQRARLATLPMHALAQVAEARIGIVHGDAESLAGWRFDPSALAELVPSAWLRSVFAQSKVDVFASSHTCARALRVFVGLGAVINNGAAGMGSVAGSCSGVITRIGLEPAPRDFPVVASAQVARVHLQALAVHFDDARWQETFLSMWPPGTAAHTSYWRRIAHGPTA
jgi:hypothetical protein